MRFPVARYFTLNSRQPQSTDQQIVARDRKRMYSGPGHDAQSVIDVIPTTMTLPSEGGHSHCGLEFTPVKNCLKGANVLLKTLLSIDQQ